MMRRVSWMQRGWAARGEGPGSSIDEAMGVIAHGVETSIPLTLQIAGPAAISAVPTTLIHRHVPSSNGEIENQDIPFVEFTEPDLLWRFSPRTQGTPAPWLTLVVVAERDVTLRASATGLNSVELQPESLPSVDALRLWAHAEVDAEGSGFCRLLSPRRMAPDTSYIALLIPTFSGTRASLLG